MFDELVEIICNYVDVQPADVHEESRFMEDLGFTSFDFMSMLGEIEDTFDVEIEQTKAAEIRTVQEAIDYLDIKNLDPEKRIEVEVSCDDCAIVKLN
jgi:acyl carrier protein